jgi:8-hydroxy-5-deazaflavin:NADPH oxidoreductase
LRQIKPRPALAPAAAKFRAVFRVGDPYHAPPVGAARRLKTVSGQATSVAARLAFMVRPSSAAAASGKYRDYASPDGRAQWRTKMKVGILGSGDVAKALAAGFVKHGHQVTLGTRDPGKLKGFLAQHPGAQAASFADAAKFGELVVLAVKGNAALDALKAAGAANLSGKPVIDATNPIAEAPPTNGVLKFFTNLDQSLMEQLQKAFPDAHFVKAYNSVGNARMINPDFPGGATPTMFICGNDDKAKAVVRGINEQFGWETADMGTAEAARAIEPLCMLWCIQGFTKNEWTHAFKLLHKA